MFKNEFRPIRFSAFLLLIAMLLGTSLSSSIAFAQVVQIPGSGSFNLSTTVAVPDRGSTYAGGSGRNAIGSTSRGYGSTAYGGSSGASSVTVKATVIDLDELDQMIRSQAGNKPTAPQLSQTDPTLYTRITTAPRGRIPRPDYDYLAVLSGHAGNAPGVSGYGATHQEYDRESTRYYLERAALAKQRGHWASVEMYYRLAWESLPGDRRETALKALAEARAKLSEERAYSAGQAKAKSQRDSKNSR
ncbi:MAG: hypothetical protein WCI02_08395 [Planctomycetota bacterium]